MEITRKLSIFIIFVFVTTMRFICTLYLWNISQWTNCYFSETCWRQQAFSDECTSLIKMHNEKKQYNLLQIVVCCLEVAYNVLRPNKLTDRKIGISMPNNIRRRRNDELLKSIAPKRKKIKIRCERKKNLIFVIRPIGNYREMFIFHTFLFLF